MTLSAPKPNESAGPPGARGQWARRCRGLLGPALVGLAVWCAAGTVSVASVDAPARLVVPAHWGWLLGGAVAALLVTGWRRSPWLASPAIPAVLPWLPVPLPVSLLLWTGPLAWVPVGLALVAGLFAGRQPHRGDSRSAVAWRQDAFLAGVLTAFASAAVLVSLDPRLPGGDEPHYLVITQSLLRDGDLRIENNHAARDYATYWNGDLAPDFIQRGRDGEIYSIHAPGVSAFVAPAFALFGLRGAQLTILGASALTGALLWVAGWLASRSRSAAWFGWAAVAGSLTFLVQSVMIFPDAPGATMVAGAVVLWLLLARGSAVASVLLCAVSLLLAALPFFHTRFVVLSAGFGIAIFWQLWRETGRHTPVARARRIAAFLGLPAAGALMWFGYFLAVYGSPNPSIAYGAVSETRLAYIPGGIAGLLVDQQFGLFTYAPVLGLALVVPFLRRNSIAAPVHVQLRLLPLALIGLAYAAVVSTYWMWWAGVPATPARLLTSVLPLFAPFVAVAWARGGTTLRAAAMALLALSLVTSGWLLLTDAGALAWNTRGPRAAWASTLGTVVDVSRAWPSFFWNLTPGVVRSELPFAMHVALFVATFVLSALIVAAITRRVPGDASVIACVWVLLLGSTGAAAAGWWLNDVDPLNPASSQLAVLGRFTRGQPVFELAAGRAARLRSVPASMKITVPRVEPANAIHADWLPLAGVPPGVYDIQVWSPRPNDGTLAVRIGSRLDPSHPVLLSRAVSQTVPLDLRGGAALLRFEPDDAFRGGVERLQLVPRRLSAPRDTIARRMSVFSGKRVFFFDDEGLLDAGGFWVRGEKTARMLVTTEGRSDAVLRLRVSNGPRANSVTLLVEGRAQTLSLGPGETRDVDVRLSDGATDVSVTSGSGFRPSDDGRSQDTRWLGVRIEVLPEGEGTQGVPSISQSAQ